MAIQEVRPEALKKNGTRKASPKKADKKLSLKSAKKRKAKVKSGKLSAKAEKRSSAVLEKKKKVAAAKTKSKALAAKAVEATPEVPAYLQTPSAEMLRSFRKASERSRKEAAKSQRKTKGNFLAKPGKKGRQYSIDLRIHSPGTVGYFSTGGVDPGPALVRLAAVKGLDMIGVTDYYNASYVDLVKTSAEKTNLRILPGVVLCAAIGVCQEVFLIALFPEHYQSAEVFSVLQQLGVPRAAYGRKDYCLTAPLKKIIEIVEANGGVLIPSRMDKTPYRQLAIPTLVEEFGIHAFDLVHPENTAFFEERWPDGEFTFFSFSNANSLAQIGTREGRVKLAAEGFAGISELVRRRTGEEVSGEILSATE